MRKLALALCLLSTPAIADVSIGENKKTVTVNCAKDKAVSIDANNAKVTLTSTCTKLNISGNDAEVTGSVIDIEISGNNNKLTLEATLSINVSGNKNTISYKKSTDAKKKVGVSNVGNNNKIAQAK